MNTYEILSGGKRLDNGEIVGPYSVIVIADNGKVRKMVDRRQNIADIEAATAAV